MQTTVYESNKCTFNGVDSDKFTLFLFVSINALNLNFKYNGFTSAGLMVRGTVRINFQRNKRIGLFDENLAANPIAEPTGPAVREYTREHFYLRPVRASRRLIVGRRGAGCLRRLYMNTHTHRGVSPVNSRR